MIKLYDEGVYLVNGDAIVKESEAEKVEKLTGKKANKEEAKKGTIAYSILEAHNTSSDMDKLKMINNELGKVLIIWKEVYFIYFFFIKI